MNDPKIFTERDVLIGRVGEMFHVTRAQVLGRTRGHADLAWARQIVYYALRKSNWTLMDIGTVMHRDHSSVHHGISTVERRMRASIADARLVELICAPVEGDYREEEAALAALVQSTATIHAAVRNALELMRSLEAEARAIRESVAADMLRRNTIQRVA